MPAAWTLLVIFIHLWHGSQSISAADTEVPKVLFCPPDIVKETAHNEIRVNWERPRFSDNSGNDPVVTGNRQSGDYFSSPGKNQIIYTATDQSGNEAHCSFTIQLSRKTCKLYSPPVDGSLTCMDLSDGLKFCSVQCKDGKEYTFSPPMLYYCSSGAWNFRPLPGMPYETTLPWPDCSAPSGKASWLKRFGIATSFSGSCQDPNVQEKLKNDFLATSKSQFVPPMFCQLRSDCKKENIQVYCGTPGAA